MKKLWIVLAFLALALWCVPLFTTPTFDLDESLYRQSALEMKQSKNYLAVTWEGKPYYDKPPTYFWSLVAISKWIDSDNEVSLVAVKLPSLIATYLTAFLACLFWFKSYPLFIRRFREKGLSLNLDQDERTGSVLLPALFLGWALLPTAGGSTAILDPLLTLFLTPILLFFAFCYLRDCGEIKKISFFHSVFIGLCMTLACMIKGPIGLIIPGFSIFVHELISSALQKEKGFFTRFFSRAKTCLKIFSPMFLIAIGLSFLFYAMIYFSGGKEFVSQFFFVQNFKRGLTAFEGHSGSLFYYPIVMFAGGFVLIPILLVGLITGFKNKLIRTNYPLWGYALSWGISIMVFYTFIATKLPHYTWPMWIAFAVLMPIVLLFGMQFSFYQIIFWIVPFCISLVLLSGGVILTNVLPFLKLDYRAYAVLNTILPLPMHVKLTFVLCGLIVFFVTFYSVYLVKNQKLNQFKSIAIVTGLNSLLIFSACLGLLPFVKNVYWLPFVRLSEFVEMEIKRDGGTFATIGLNSPTVTTSFHLFYVPQYPLKETMPFQSKITYVLVPVWLENRCKEYDYVIAKKDYYLSVCRFGK